MNVSTFSSGFCYYMSRSGRGDSGENKMKSLLAMLSFLILLSACQSRGINDEYAVALQECLEGDLIVRDISYKEKHYSSLAINKNCLYQEEVTGTSMFSGNGDFPVMVFCPGQALPCQEYGALFVRYQFPRRDEITHGLQMSATLGTLAHFLFTRKVGGYISFPGRENCSMAVAVKVSLAGPFVISKRMRGKASAID